MGILEEKDPFNGEPYEMKLKDEIVSIVFYIIVVGKTLAFDWGFYNYIRRYYTTYKKCNQVEIWLLLLTAIKVTVLMPNYFIREINYLYAVFIINSATTFWLSHILHIRSCIIQERSECTARCFLALTVARVCLLIIIIFGGNLVDRHLFKARTNTDKGSHIILRCDEGEVYPM